MFTDKKERRKVRKEERKEERTKVTEKAYLSFIFAISIAMQ